MSWCDAHRSSTSLRIRGRTSRPSSSRECRRSLDGVPSVGRPKWSGTEESSSETDDGAVWPQMGNAEIVGVANPEAGKGRARRYARRLDRVLRAGGLSSVIRFTSAPLDAMRLTREAIDSGAKTVLAIGGDGTVNEVINGFLQAGGSNVAQLALAPVGTGTDFARTLGQGGDAGEVLARLQRGRRRAIDLGFVDFTDLEGKRASRYFVNIAEFGSGGAVVDRVNRTTKILGGRMSFLLAILSTLPKYRNRIARWRIDGGPWIEAVVNNFVVANGRFFGGGLMPAPYAELDDGALDVVVIDDVDFKTVRHHLNDLRRGTHVGLKLVRYVRARVVETEGTDGALVDLDGELVGVDPTHFVCVPRAIDVLV